MLPTASIRSRNISLNPSAYGCACFRAASALRIFAAATCFIALVICCVFFKDLIRSRRSRTLGISCLAYPPRRKAGGERIFSRDPQDAGSVAKPQRGESDRPGTAVAPPPAQHRLRPNAHQNDLLNSSIAATSAFALSSESAFVSAIDWVISGCFSWRKLMKLCAHSCSRAVSIFVR